MTITRTTSQSSSCFDFTFMISLAWILTSLSFVQSRVIEIIKPTIIIIENGCRRKNTYLFLHLFQIMSQRQTIISFSEPFHVKSSFFLLVGRKTNAKQLIDLNSVGDRNYMLSNFYGTQSFVKTYFEQEKKKKQIERKGKRPSQKERKKDKRRKERKRRK